MAKTVVLLPSLSSGCKAGYEPNSCCPAQPLILERISLGLSAHYGIHTLTGSPPLLSYSPWIYPLSPKLYQDSPDHPPLLTHIHTPIRTGLGSLLHLQHKPNPAYEKLGLFLSATK